jgi:hypothetical protein
MRLNNYTFKKESIMEIIIGVIIVGLALAIYLNFKKKDSQVVDVPYKVEEPVQPVANTVAVAVALDLEGAEATLAKKPRAPRKPKAVAEKKPAAKKVAAKKAPAKKPKAK